MKKGDKLYEGKAKMIFATEDESILWVEYKDDATAFNGLKKGSIEDKGYYNNQISAHLFSFLKGKGLDNHFVELLSDREMLVRNLEILPVEVVVRNITAGNMAKRLGLDEGVQLDEPILELYYKNDDLADPLINDDHVLLLNAATKDQLSEMKKQALKVNSLLKPYLEDIGLKLIDYKLEFGLYQGQVLLGDEISPDTCRLWDINTGEKLDKDRFRRDLGGVREAYAEILRRLKDQLVVVNSFVKKKRNFSFTKKG